MLCGDGNVIRNEIVPLPSTPGPLVEETSLVDFSRLRTTSKGQHRNQRDQMARL